MKGKGKRLRKRLISLHCMLFESTSLSSIHLFFISLSLYLTDRTDHAAPLLPSTLCRHAGLVELLAGDPGFAHLAGTDDDDAVMDG